MRVARSMQSANTRGGVLLVVSALPRRPAPQQRAETRSECCKEGPLGSSPRVTAAAVAAHVTQMSIINQW